MNAARKLHAGPAELAYRRRRGAGSLKGVEQSLQGLLNLLIGIQYELLVRIVCKAHGRSHEQLSAGLVQNAALQSGSQNVQFGFAHRAFQAEQQSVIEVRRIVNAILIEDQGIGECADFQQPVPVHRVARQTGHLKAENNAGARD